MTMIFQTVSVPVLSQKLSILGYGSWQRIIALLKGQSTLSLSLKTAGSIKLRRSGAWAINSSVKRSVLIRRTGSSAGLTLGPSKPPVSQCRLALADPLSK